MPWHVQGRLPFRAKDQAGLFKAIVKGVYDPLPDSFSAPLKHIMKGMLMINPVSFSSHNYFYHTLALISPVSHLLQCCSYHTRALITLLLLSHLFHFCYSLALITLWLSPHSCSYHTLALISPLSLLLQSCPYCTLALNLPLLVSCSDGQVLCLIANSSRRWLVHLLAHTVVNMLASETVELA